MITFMHKDANNDISNSLIGMFKYRDKCPRNCNLTVFIIDSKKLSHLFSKNIDQ